MRRSICISVMLLASVFIFGRNDQPAPSAGQDSPSPSSKSKHPANEPWFSQRHPRYEMRPGDVFDLTFDYTPELNQTVTVQPDGFASLRRVGDIYVVGQTVPELTNNLRNAYGSILNHPVVSVVLKDFEKPYFIADGQVGHPGKYELRGDTTVVQAIAMAGGFLATAKHSKVVLYRRVSDDWTEAKLINVKKMQSEYKLWEDIHLQPGDMLFVPKNGFSKIAPFIPTASLSMMPRTF